MDKFSLYDFLGLLLPGVIFVFFCNTLNELFCVYPIILNTANWGINIGISLVFAIIVGAVLYTSNFYLVQKKWYNKTFGMYKHVADLYLEMQFLHKLMNETLNLKARELYEKCIFLTKIDFYKLNDKEQKEIKDLQSEYFDQMYYELEYQGKKEHLVSFHSFYFFFRQTALACIMLILIILVLGVLQFLPWTYLKNLELCTIFQYIGLFILMLVVSVVLARWYRKRSVMKMYWAYYTYLKLNMKDGNNR